MKQIDTAEDKNVRGDAEWRYLRTLHKTLYSYDYYRSQRVDINPTLDAFAACMPKRLSAARKATLMQDIGAAAQRGDFKLDNFEPMARLLGKLANMPHDGAPPALLDPVFEETATALARGVRSLISLAVHDGGDSLAHVNEFLGGLKTSVIAGYSVNTGAREATPRAFVVFDCIYSKVFDDRSGYGDGWTIKNNPTVALLRRQSGDRRVRHAMWRLGNPLKARLVAPIAKILDGASLKVANGKELPDVVRQSMYYDQPLPPKIMQHCAHRRSRYVIA